MKLCSVPSLSARCARVSIFALALIVGLTASLPVYAASSSKNDDRNGRDSSGGELEVSGWIPYWSGSKGTKDTAQHLDQLDVIHPFSYSVKADGTIHDLAGMAKSAWKSLVKKARSEDVLVVPTIASNDGVLTHSLLSSSKIRKKHVEEIVELVDEKGYDGIDIDYEGKLAQTKDYFSIFLKELDAALEDEDDDLVLTCTVEARTPPESLYRNPPAVMQYANDYPAMARYCDQIEIMAYDQQRADIKLNDARRGVPYMPNADIEWVEKVVKFALKDIPRNKLVLGIPTYGTEYEVTVSPQWYQSYKRVRAINPGAAEDLAEDENVTASRNNAGEMGFTYMTGKTAQEVANYTVPKGTSKGNRVAAQALAYANATGKTTVFNVVSWSDADAIEEKVELAEEYGLRGIAIFKFDGEEDMDLWDVIEQ